MTSTKDKRKNGGDEPYVVLARKYRPATFDDLIGQAAMVQTLRNAFRTNRIAQAYMLTGLRGIGKTTTARILARALNFEREDGSGEPTVDLSEQGIHCEAIMTSRHPDVLEMDAASNTSVDNIREIIENARYAPVSARYKVYIIDEVHMLSKSAFNALLKTLEEPPAHVKFIFATTEVNRVPVTVLSRCQRFDLRRVSSDTLVEHLASIASREGAEVADEALRVIARASEGSVRDGLSVLDQAIAHEDGAVTADTVRDMLGLADRGRIMDLLSIIMHGNTADALASLEALHGDGAEPKQIVTDLSEAIHVVTRLKATGGKGPDMDLSDEERSAATALSESLSVPALTRAWQMVLKGLGEMAMAPDQNAVADMLVIRLTHVANLPTPDDLIRLLPELQDDGSGSEAAPASGNGTAQPSAPQQASAPNEVLGLDITDQPPANANSPTLSSFRELADFVGEQRDIILKTHLEHDVHLVAFAPYRVELRPTENAPRTLLNELNEKMKRWTGEKWTFTASSEPGVETLAQTRAREHEQAVADVREHPLVRETLKAFPDAEIVSVEPSDKSPQTAPEKTGSGEQG